MTRSLSDHKMKSWRKVEKESNLKKGVKRIKRDLRQDRFVEEKAHLKKENLPVLEKEEEDCNSSLGLNVFLMC